MPNILGAAYKAWQQLDNKIAFAEWLEIQKINGLYWGA